MESNKEEAFRCIEIAKEKLAQGNQEGYIKFLKKSINLYPNEQAKILIDKYNSAQSSSTTAAPSQYTSTTTTTTSTTSSTTANDSSSADNKPKYTQEQIVAIKRIKTCKTFYDVLEVSKTASDVEIKKAYRKLALQMHPDKNHAPGSEEAFKIVTQAFSCLSDSKKRQTYDLHGSEDTPVNRSPFSRGGGVYYEDDLSPEDIFNVFFGIPTRQGARNRNVYYNSSPFGTGNGVHFSFGGDPRLRRRQQQQGQQGQQDNQSLFSLLFMLLPLLFIVFSLFGGGSNSNSSSSSNNSFSSIYSFTATPVFHREKIIFIKEYDIQIEYYVKKDFESVLRYNGVKVDYVENEIVKKWVELKHDFCKKKEELEKKYKEAEDSPTHQTFYKNEIEKNAKNFQYCDVLKKNKII
ncbi:hypothetical protein CYY_007585 [Polysphondylium violaceum]|uniref:J domain-containing protein n=1 Tax=Polysphondylium violaceum TaxID=133409 RepID=A0A8J4V4T1_9MYCE|nr:hypothetical protein CYY_007585 [Polysphondylium violaceum]